MALMGSISICLKISNIEVLAYICNHHGEAGRLYVFYVAKWINSVVFSYLYLRRYGVIVDEIKGVMHAFPSLG